MADTLPGDLVVTYQDAFQHFDTNQTGFIPTKQLGPLLRFCAENPSEAEIQVSLEIYIAIYHELITLPICMLDLFRNYHFAYLSFKIGKMFKLECRTNANHKSMIRRIMCLM